MKFNIIAAGSHLGFIKYCESFFLPSNPAPFFNLPIFFIFLTLFETNLSVTLFLATTTNVGKVDKTGEERLFWGQKIEKKAKREEKGKEERI